MSLSEIIRRYLLYGLSGPLIFLNLWVLVRLFKYFEGVITFIILGAILALLLNYLVQIFERFSLTRIQAVMVVLGLFLGVLTLLGFTLVPVLTKQATLLMQGLPALFEAGNRNLNWFQAFVDRHELPIDLNRITSQLSSRAEGFAATLPEFAINTVGQIFTTIFLIVLAFYMLLYGDRFWQGLIKLLPPHLGDALSISLQQQFHYFFKSQLLLALIMVLFLAPTFLILHINFGLLLAMVVGLFEIIPLFGATIGISLVTLLVLMLQGFLPAFKVAAFGIFFQQLTDNVIAPRLVGKMIGMNPIWIFITLLIGYRVAGFIGVVLSRPIAGAIKDTVEAMKRFHAENERSGV